MNNRFVCVPTVAVRGDMVMKGCYKTPRPKFHRGGCGMLLGCSRGCAG